MRRTLGVLAFLFALLGPSAWAAAAVEAPRCKARMLADIDLTRERDGTYLVPVTIGTEAVWLELNTWSSVTMLQESAIPRLHLDAVLIRGNLADVKVDGQLVARKANLPSLTTGGFTYSAVVAGVSPGTADAPLPDVEGKPVVGRLGIDVLSRTDFELHLAANKLRLFSPDHCRGVGAYWTDQYARTPFGKDPFGKIYFAVELDGKSIEADLNTASELSTLDSNVTLKAYGFDENSPGIETQNSGRATYRAMTLTLPQLRVSDVRIRLRTPRDDCGYRQRIDSGRKAIAYGKCFGFPLGMGRDVLERMRLYVALRQREIYFTEAGAGL